MRLITRKYGTSGCPLTVSLFSYRLPALSLNGSRECVDTTCQIDILEPFQQYDKIVKDLDVF